MRDDTGISFLQLALDVKIVGRLLIGALGFLDLAVGFDDVRLRRHQRGVDLGDLAASGFQRRFLLRAVEFEDDVYVLVVNENLVDVAADELLDLGHRLNM